MNFFKHTSFVLPNKSEAQIPVAKLQMSVSLFLDLNSSIFIARTYFHLDYDNCHKVSCFIPF